VHTANGSKLRLDIHSQPKMLVTFSGVDGCGKTTHARALQNAFATCHLRADYLWSRAGSSGWLSAIIRLFRPKEEGAVNRTEELAEVPRRRSFESPKRRWGWSWLTTVESLWLYFRRVTWPLLRGHVVICDRYVYDTWADWSANYRQRAEESIAARVLQFLSPKPTLAFSLDVPADVAQDRSAGGSHEMFSSRVAAYRRIARSQSLHVVDGNESLETSNSTIVFDTLDYYFSHYRTVINQLFLKNPGQWR
jgi:thymidylate kinase